MRSILIILSSLLYALSSFGQSDEIENWRQMGYAAKTDRDFPAAIGYYQKILDAAAPDVNILSVLQKAQWQLPVFGLIALVAGIGIAATLSQTV